MAAILRMIERKREGEKWRALAHRNNILLDTLYTANLSSKALGQACILLKKQVHDLWEWSIWADTFSDGLGEKLLDSYYLALRDVQLFVIGGTNDATTGFGHSDWLYANELSMKYLAYRTETFVDTLTDKIAEDFQNLRVPMLNSDSMDLLEKHAEAERECIENVKTAHDLHQSLVDKMTAAGFPPVDIIDAPNDTLSQLMINEDNQENY